MVMVSFGESELLETKSSQQDGPTTKYLTLKVKGRPPQLSALVCAYHIVALGLKPEHKIIIFWSAAAEGHRPQELSDFLLLFDLYCQFNKHIFHCIVKRTKLTKRGRVGLILKTLRVFKGSKHDHVGTRYCKNSLQTLLASFHRFSFVWCFDYIP